MVGPPNLDTASNQAFGSRIPPHLLLIRKPFLTEEQDCGPHLYSSPVLAEVWAAAPAWVRTFSLASADLLSSNGPDNYLHRGKFSQPKRCSDEGGLVLSPERGRCPLGWLVLRHCLETRGTYPWTPRRLSLAPPRDELSLASPPPAHSSSMSLQAEREYIGSSSSRAGAVRSGPAQTRAAPHRGEVGHGDSGASRIGVEAEWFEGGTSGAKTGRVAGVEESRHCELKFMPPRSSHQ